ncbi:MAG: hypothetical protein H6636_04410 [Anaerolineales bacterium]|nr:hypothetical protein [Anaerolineales bacterium]
MPPLLTPPPVENIPPRALYVPRHETATYLGQPNSQRGMPPVSAGNPSPVNVPNAPTNLIPHLLEALNLPTDQLHLTLARALLDQNLPVTAQTLAELTQALAEIPHWGPPEALAAAQLKAAGLPIVPAALALLLQDTPPLSETLTRLTQGLRTLRQPLPEALADLLPLLENLPLPADTPPADLAAHTQHTLTLLYRSLEHSLATSSDAPDSLLTLVCLRDTLAEHAPHLLKDFDQFFDSLRHTHLLNADPQTPLPNGRWLTVALPILLPNPPNDLTPTTAHLRLARPPDDDPSAPLDPAQTRLVLEIALTETQTMTVDLTIVNRQIGLQILVPDPALQQAAETELPTLETALAETGFTLRTARCTIAQDSAETNRVHLSGLNVEI